MKKLGRLPGGIPLPLAELSVEEISQGLYENGFRVEATDFKEPNEWLRRKYNQKNRTVARESRSRRRNPRVRVSGSYR